MIILRPTHLHWIKDAADDPRDLCAHSPVEFNINGRVLVGPNDGDWTVSAAALYLLRTLTRDHTREQPVGDHLFPCCGFSLYDIKGQEDVVICGCPNGLDFSIRHAGAEVHIDSESVPMITVSSADWRSAVHAFSDEVQAFYLQCAPKKPQEDEDVKGFRVFMKEWERRRSTS